MKIRKSTEEKEGKKKANTFKNMFKFWKVVTAINQLSCLRQLCFTYLPQVLSGRQLKVNKG